MHSFKWDDASDRLMLLAYLETTNSMPRDYEPIALVLGPQVSTKMVHARLQKLLGEAAAARQVATNFSRATSSDKGRKRIIGTTTSDIESEEEVRIPRKRSKKKPPKAAEVEVLVTSAPGTDQGTSQSDESDHPSERWKVSRQPEVRVAGQDQGRQLCRTTKDTTTQPSTRDKGRQQALGQTDAMATLAARTKPISRQGNAERAKLTKVASRDSSHAAETNPQRSQELRATTVVNAETENPQSPIDQALLSHPVSPIPPTHPSIALGQVRTLDKHRRTAERARQSHAKSGWRLASGGEVISDGVSESVASSSSVKEESKYSDGAEIGDNSGEDSNMQSVKEEEIEDLFVPSPEGPVTTHMQLRSADNPKKEMPRLAWEGLTRNGQARIVKLPRHVCIRLSRNSMRGALRIQRKAGADHINVKGHRKLKAGEPWAEVAGSDKATEKVLVFFQALVDRPNIPLEDALAAVRQKN